MCGTNLTELFFFFFGTKLMSKASSKNIEIECQKLFSIYDIRLQVFIKYSNKFDLVLNKEKQINFKFFTI